MTRKLAGKAAGTASWATNVGNEYGQVLMSVLTDSEGDGLGEMAIGLMNRYQLAKQSPPKVIYVDRECCSSGLKSKFNLWSDVVVRMDVWHFVRRFAAGCSSESHAMYPTFMSRLSGSIFQWDAEDLQRLHAAKKSELRAKGTWSVRKEDVLLHTVEPRFNEPLFNEVLDITNDIISMSRPKLQ